MFVSPVIHWLVARRELGKVRTPDARFNHLKEFPFVSSYMEMTFPEIPAEDLRVHYIDVNPTRSHKTVLLLHDSYTWSYMFRKMITKFYQEEVRSVALDFIGSGKSDKLCSPEHYSYGLHVQTVMKLIDELELTNIHLVGLGWGSTVAMSVATKYPEKIDGMFLMRGRIPIGLLNDGTGGDGIKIKTYQRVKNLLPALNWRLLTNLFERFLPVDFYFLYNELVLTDFKVLESYNAPFVSRDYKGGLQKWPEFMPFYDDDGLVPEMEEVIAHFKAQWNKPVVAIQSLADGRVENESWRLVKLIPNTNVITVKDPSNILPESHGANLAAYMALVMENDYAFVIHPTVKGFELTTAYVDDNGDVVLTNHDEGDEADAPEVPEVRKNEAIVVTDEESSDSGLVVKVPEPEPASPVMAY